MPVGKGDAGLRLALGWGGRRDGAWGDLRGRRRRVPIGRGGTGTGEGRKVGSSEQQVVAALLPSGCIDPTISLDVKY